MSKLPVKVMSPRIEVPGEINVVLPDAELLTTVSLRFRFLPLFWLGIMSLIIALFVGRISLGLLLTPL